MEYESIALEPNEGIHTHYIPKEVIEALGPQLDEHWEGVPAVSKTHQRHFKFPSVGIN